MINTNAFSLIKKKSQKQGIVQKPIQNRLSNNESLIKNSIMQDSKILKIQDKQKISFQPKQLTFSIKNQTEIQELQIQNISSQPIKVKLFHPKTKYFKVIYESISSENYLICPGLIKKVQIQFKNVNANDSSTKVNKSSNASLQNSFYDSFKIVLEEKSFEIPLKAVKGQPKMSYEKIINLGFVDLNKLIKLSKKIKNPTNQTLKLRLIKQSWQNMHILPQQFSMKPFSQEIVEFCFTPTIIGAYHHKILVEANSSCTLSPIEIIYNTYDYNYCISDANGNKINDVDFGYMFYGQKKIQSFYAINNTPNTVEMKGKIRIGNKGNLLETTFQSPQQYGQQCSSTLAEVFPKNLKIAPFSKQKFTLTSFGKVTEQNAIKVAKFGKSFHMSGILKTHKRLAETAQKYKIEDEQFHESFISEFFIINSTANSQKGKKNINNNQQQISRTNPISNIVLIELKVQYGLPTIKISPSDFDIGQVYLGKPTSSKFSVSNQNPTLPVKISFNKIIGVQIFPKQCTLKPLEDQEFELYITAVNLGSVNEALKVKIEENYAVECRLKYQVLNDITRPMTKNYQHRSVHVDHTLGQTAKSLDKIDFNSTISMLSKTQNKQMYFHGQNKVSSYFSSHQSGFKIKKYNSQSKSGLNISKKDSRSLMNNTDGFKGYGRGSNKHIEQGSSFDLYDHDKDRNDKKKNKKVDNADIHQLQQQCHPHSVLKSTKIQLPNSKENLFVTKKIDKYEPYNLQRNSRKLLKSKTSKDFFSNVIKRQPRNRREAQEITMQLKGESLKLIKINTKVINFGKMFVGSRMQKDFVIQNDTQYSIQIRLIQNEIENPLQKLESEMLNGTDYQEQIVPSHSAANFKIYLWAKQCGKFQKAITYTINKIHEFQFLVEAQIELAQLTVNKNVLKMSYLDDISEMNLKDNFTLKNQGNAPTEFSISQLSNNFSIEPSQGLVMPGSILDVCVTHNNPNPTIILAGETPSTQSKQQVKSSSINHNFIDERINIDIKNGITMSMRVTFNPTIAEPKCIVKESKLNFGVAIVSKSKTKSFLLRNISRTMTLFEIQNVQCPEYLYFDITKGKLPPQSSKQITVTYKSSIIQSIESSFKINIRGGLVITVPVIVESVAPNIKLSEEDNYNFGDVCCGTSVVKAVNVINDSQTVVELLLDLLDKRAHGMEYLYVSFINNNSNTCMTGGKESRMVLTQNEGNNQKQGILKNKNSTANIFTLTPMNYQDYFSTSDQAIIDNACVQPEIHKLKILPKSVYTFYLVFKPKLPGYYEFQIPLYLQNFIKNDALNKVITCFATQPKFIIQPSVIRFKKKIINQKQSTTFHPLIEFLTLKNPGDKQLKWKIDYQFNSVTNTSTSNPYTTVAASTNGSVKTFNSISPNNASNNRIQHHPSTLQKPHASSQNPHITSSPDKFCFEIQNKKGQVKPGSWECINIAFNPYEAGIYCYKLPLLIYNEQRGVYQQQAQIRLQGEGQYPSLYFDRKQLIMPVVPISVESVGMFKIINEGYQTISLKHRIEMYDIDGNCIIQGSNYYQNNQTSNSIPDIHVIYPEGVKMGINKKQLYIIVKFTCKKAISFTCKLELFDNTRDCRIYSLPISGTSDNSVLTLFPYLSDIQNRYKFTPTNLPPSNNYTQEKSKIQQNYLINIQSTDDRTPVDKYHNIYEKMTHQQFTQELEIIRRWINGFLKDQKIGKFPEDIATNPQNLLKLLYKITAKKQFQTMMQVISTTSLPESYQTSLNNQQNQSKIFNSTIPVGNNPYAQSLSVPNHFNNKLEFYQYLIRLLKSLGCFLNHIRPYFLLEKSEFFSYLQKDSNWKNISQTYTNQYYEVIHYESWVILFYQIISNFWYNTSKLKGMLAQTNNQNQLQDKTGLPLGVSNVYSQNQMMILRWVKNIYEKYNQFEDSFYKFISYGDGFKDCVGAIYAIFHHIVNPAKKKKALQGLTKKPNTPNEISSNVRILYSLIEKVGLNPLIYEQEFQFIKEKQMFLFLYQLYQLLPQQLPKSEPILFQCYLGEKCTKFIEIKNTSNKVVNYWVKLQGSRDFSHEEKESIKVEPKSTYKFKVNFESRLSDEQIAYLTFLNKLQTDSTTSPANSTAQGSTLVFELKSKILGRKSIKKLEPIYCSLYETQTIRIPIQNHFQDCQFGNFEVNLFEEIIQGNQINSNIKPKLYKLKRIKQNEMTQQSDYERQNNLQLNDNHLNKKFTQKQLASQTPESQQSSAQSLEMMNFFVDSQTIKIKRNGSSFLELMFNPVIYKKVRCYLVFYDSVVGEFQYQIIGISQMPKILQEIKYTQQIYTGTREVLDVNLPIYNNFMIKAEILMEQKMYSKNGRQKTIKKLQNDVEKFKMEVNMDQKILQYVTFPHQFSIKNARKQSTVTDIPNNKLKLQCNFPFVIKDLSLDFLLINQSKKDVRRIKLSLNLASKPIVNELILKTTARLPIFQPIPIQNTSIKDWRVKATLTEEQQNDKNGFLSLKEGEKLLSKDFVVKKHNSSSQFTTQNNLIASNKETLVNNQANNQSSSHPTSYLSLVFNPSWLCRLRAKLTIHNITTNEQLIYHIRAISEEPVSESHVYFKIKTLHEEVKKVMIKNPYSQGCSWKAETDIEQIKFTQQRLYLQGKGEVGFNIMVNGKISNKVIGYIKFTDDQGRFFWYTITIDFYEDNEAVKDPLKFYCPIGEQVSQNTQIYNPTHQKQKFLITYPQNSGMSGETQIQIQSLKRYELKMIFNPKQLIDRQDEVKIVNKVVGEVRVKVDLKSEQKAKKPTIQIMTAEVGKSVVSTFKLSNSLKTPVKIKCQFSHKKYFNFVGLNEMIPAKCNDHEVKVQFKPLEQGLYPCVLKISGQQFQTKCYEIEGKGLQPFSVETIEMKSSLGKPCLQVIKFKNPSKKLNEKVEILLEDKNFEHNCFMIIKDKGESKKWQAVVSDVLGIPVQFLPQQKGYYQSMLYIRCAQYQWKYLLKGTVASKAVQTVQQKIEGECKKPVVKVLKIPIPSYFKKNPNFSIFELDRISLEHEDAKINDKIKSWMQVKIQTPLEDHVHDDEELTLLAKLNAHQPLDEIVSIHLFNSQNQSLRLTHKVQLKVNPSKPEQTITLEVDSIKKYKFDLNLDEMGILTKKTAKKCEMLKKQYVECRFKSGDDSSPSSFSSITKLQTQNNKVQITFCPNNLLFNAKNKNTYSDILMVFTQKTFWSCQVCFKLNTGQIKTKK